MDKTELPQFNFFKLLQSFTYFLKKLLSDRWRSLLMVLVGVTLPLLIFGTLAIVVLENKGGFPWDEPILLAVHQVAQPQLDILAETLTKFGVLWGVFPVASVTTIALFYQRKWRSLAYLLITIPGSHFINHTAKGLLHRVRPHLWSSLSPEFDYSFPSGHAMSSMTLIAVIVILTWGTRWRWLILSFGSLFVVAIGWTRLYLGVHFPSDILAGWMVSLAWSVGVSLILRPHSTKAIASNQEQAASEI